MLSSVCLTDEEHNVDEGEHQTGATPGSWTTDLETAAKHQVGSQKTEAEGHSDGNRTNLAQNSPMARPISAG
jgi:hypothetical protein